MISLFVDNGVAYVWNSNDWHVLRTSLRICGSLVGSIPSFPRQNDFQGLPMALMSEEAALLVEMGVCELLALPKILEPPDEKEKEEINALETNVLEEQKDALRKRQIEQLSQKIDIIVAGKKQKLLSKGITNIHLDKQMLLQEEINKLPNLSAAHVLVHLPTEHFRNTEKKKLSIDVLCPCILDEKGTSKYSIFKDLWNKGFHITNGSKFGSDFLVYPGDPVKFHAMYMLRYIPDNKTAFNPASLVAFGRLSVAVNKVAVLAFCTIYGRIEYQTLQWHDTING